MRLFVLYLFSNFILPYAKAQDMLPGFSAYLKSNGKVLISWRNGYPAINQISIQRSADSLHNFITLITVPDPRIPENGFVDTKSNGNRMFYRIFILLPNSKYLFTKSKRAILEPAEQPLVLAKSQTKEKPKPVEAPSTVPKKQIIPPAELTQLKPENPVTEEENYLILPKIDNSRILYMMEVPNKKKPLVGDPGKIKATNIQVD